MLNKSTYRLFLSYGIVPVSIFLLYALYIKSDAATIFGGIIFFLLGMVFMEDGFRSFSGGVLEKILSKFTSTTPKAIATGFLSTAIVQSSSLISIIVISFLSVGLINLTAGVGVIFGSNIGTTATAWLVSAFGVKIKISSFAIPMLIVGFLLTKLKDKNTAKGVGYILFGLAFIFLGIAGMKEGFETIKEGIDLSQYAVAGYLGIFIYVLIGAIMTVVIQSSSATMAIIITALAVGSISYESSLALAIGANVGTTVSAAMGAMTSNENGKRLAVAHLIFNMITGLIAIALIYQLTDLVDYISVFIGIGLENYAMKLALFHTIFNIIGVLAVSPFIGILVKYLETLFIPKVSEEGKVKYLDFTAIDLPEIAYINLKKEAGHLYDNAFKIIAHGLNLKRSNIMSSIPLNEVIGDPYSKDSIDIESFYDQNIKGIYGQIIDFAAKSQSNMSTEDIEKLYKLKLATRDIAEAVKDTKHLQKNIIKYINDDNKYISEEYNKFRIEIAEILRNIEIIRVNDDESKILTCLSKIRVHIKKDSILNNGTIDNFIRNNSITSDMATSLMKDSEYVRDISKHLLEMAEILFINDNDVITEMLLSDEDIEEINQK